MFYKHILLCSKYEINNLRYILLSSDIQVMLTTFTFMTLLPQTHCAERELFATNNQVLLRHIRQGSLPIPRPAFQGNAPHPRPARQDPTPPTKPAK